MENNEIETQTQNNSTIDYESEYKKMTAEMTRLKEAMSKTNSENAEYKKKERERLSDDEKKSLEFKELVESKNKIEAELQQMKLEKDFLANGFSQDECDNLLKNNCSPKSIAEIIKVRVEQAVSSEKANQVKNSTPQTPIGKATAEKSSFQIYQENKENNNNVVKL